MQNTTPPLILVDGSSYFYRAYHAFPPLSNREGEPTGAIYGVLNMLRSLLLTYQPSAIAVVFDAKGKTFRDHIFEAYKAHRPPMPSDLRQQIEPLHNLIKMMGIAVLCVEGVEADDVIGTLARQAEQAGYQVLISTGDKDMAQLVTDNITLINTMNNSVLGPDGVLDKYGIPPNLIIDFLALMGDSSDNIPGVEGIGQKTAQALLSHFNGLDDLYTRLEEVTQLSIRGAKKLPEKLLVAKEMAYLSQQLATIKTDVILDNDLASLRLQPIQFDNLLKNYTQYEFNRWCNELQQHEETPNINIVELINHQMDKSSTLSVKVSTLHSEEAQPLNVEHDYRLINHLDDLQHWIEQLSRASCIAFDTETDSLDYMSANLVGLSFSIVAHQAIYIPVGHDYLGVSPQLPLDEVLGLLKPVLEQENIKKIGQHIKFDMNILARYGIHLAGIAYDTMLESYLLNSQERHDMDSLAWRHLKHKTLSYEEMVGKGKNKLTFNQVEIDKAVSYAAEDADITLRLHETLSKDLIETPTLQKLFTEIEIPLVSVLSNMERTGVLIDSNLLTIHSQELALKLEQLEQEAYNLAGEHFNLASPKQLQTIFYEKLGLPILKKTPTGAASTNEEVLSELAIDYPLPKVILEYRGLAKLKSTYTDKLPLMVSSIDGRLHTSYNQIGTITGRLSSSEPNLQNIPIRNEEGRRIRQAFIASEGYQILAADYSQIELRIMAHLSGDTGLLQAFAEGQDIHQATAAEVMGVALDQVTTEQRRNAKAINFGLIYGMSAFGLARQLGISRYDAQHYIDRYFERYPGVLSYMERARQQAQELGYVETLMGRRLYLPEVRSSNAMKRKAAERAAINAPMQGTAADIIKKAMIEIDHLIKRDFSNQVKMIMQVHDELVFEVKRECIEIVTPKIIALMEHSTQLLVPLNVQVGVGNNWDEAH